MKKIQKGFTLIELMIVVAIIGILAAVAIPAFQDYITKAQISKVGTALASVQTALADYAQNNAGAFPAANGWASLGINSSGPTGTSSVSSFTLAANGVVTAFLATGIAGSATCNIVFTPTVPTGATSLKWSVSTSCTNTNVVTQISKWN
ncbi:MAG: prepilin-type N-terminal cleavage/methylation domain-containing protein [Nitrosomonadales bacterium]